MADIGFKVGQKGIDIQGDKKSLDLIVSSTYPNLKCWMRPKPTHYGTLNIHLRNVTAGMPDQNLLVVPHGYKFKPAFFAVYRSIQNSDPSTVSNGLGNFEYIDNNLNFAISPRIDSTNFYINLHDVGGTGSGSSPFVDLTYRFYIFGDELAEGQFTNL